VQLLARAKPHDNVFARYKSRRQLEDKETPSSDSSCFYVNRVIIIETIRKVVRLKCQQMSGQ
jgi:hypothetical protein